MVLKRAISGVHAAVDKKPLPNPQQLIFEQSRASRARPPTWVHRMDQFFVVDELYILFRMSKRHCITVETPWPRRLHSISFSGVSFSSSENQNANQGTVGLGERELRPEKNWSCSGGEEDACDGQVVAMAAEEEEDRREQPQPQLLPLLRPTCLASWHRPTKASW